MRSISTFGWRTGSKVWQERCGSHGALLCWVPMFGMGVGELLVGFVVVLLVFGPGRLPEMMGDLGKAMRQFQNGLREPPEIDVPPAKPTPPAEAKCE